MNLQDPVTNIGGVGPKTADLLHKLNIHTVGDLIQTYPRDYDRYEAPVRIAEIKKEGIYAVDVSLMKRPEVKLTSRIKLITAVFTDGKDQLRTVWFNMPYLAKTLRPGGHYLLRGRVTRDHMGFKLEQPVIYPREEYERLLHTRQPIYPLTKGLTNKMLQKAVRQALADCTMQKDYLPEDIRRRYELAEYNYAIETIHFPKNESELLFARKRLVFDEFFLFILMIRLLKGKNERKRNDYPVSFGQQAKMLQKALPYKLTNGQKQALRDILKNLSGPDRMSRLVQGDVGSGKTIVAILAMLSVAEAGYQSALMAPTEVLARQHYESIRSLFEKYGIDKKVALLTGSMTAKQKRLAGEMICSGEASIIIGTHALIQEKVNYHALALVITDEQHRFGVAQRESFSEKGKEPHVLVMSATPIPRTLAIIIYGDLDISIIDELPAKRLPIKNCVVDTSYRTNAYRFMEKEIRSGRQCYVICPMVEESEAMDGENVIDYAKRLEGVFPSDIKIAYLHGKMKPAEKDKLMTAFAANEVQILVSTTVVEVGVDVPNATVMMIENAERFGLAQLHQLRGRVGRGQHQSYCIFVNGSGDSEKNRRLEILNKSNDGFYIASEDLKLRGPGDVFGIRQSGIAEFRIGDVYNDAAVLKAAAEEAERILSEDPALSLEKNHILKKKIDHEIENRAEYALLL